jgi:N-acetylneuraminate synthase
VEFLESLDTAMYKIASLEIVDLPLIEAVAKTGKPVVISTGAATLADVDDAVKTVLGAGNSALTLLVCTSAYPADPADANLLRMKMLQDRYEVSVGVSDHTLGLGVSIAAVVLGATLIERHFTLDRADGGPDAAFSMAPDEFAQLVGEVRSASLALGTGEWDAISAEAESRRLRRSLYVVEDVKAGDPVSAENVRAIRPSYGMAPKHWWSLEGKKFVTDASRGTPLTAELLD